MYLYHLNIENNSDIDNKKLAPQAYDKTPSADNATIICHKAMLKVIEELEKAITAMQELVKASPTDKTIIYGNIAKIIEKPSAILKLFCDNAAQEAVEQRSKDLHIWHDLFISINHFMDVGFIEKNVEYLCKSRDMALILLEKIASQIK